MTTQDELDLRDAYSALTLAQEESLFAVVHEPLDSQRRARARQRLTDAYVNVARALERLRRP